MPRLPLLVALIALAAPSAASASVVPQRSIASIELSMTRAQVEKRLGTPERVRRPRSEIFGRYTELEYGLTFISIFDSAEGGVFSITTTSRRQRTSTGVGVGSTERAVRRGVRNVRCRTEYGFRRCSVGTFAPGRVVTDFVISTRGRVKRISLGRVID